jgi:molecular chaperone DnaK
VFQGENRDVRHNDQVGEFTIEGLAEVRRGNEILVRFDLDLDGILKVTARERATGLEKQLAIDNPVSRFRKQNRDNAPARAALVAGVGTDSGAVALTAAGTMPPWSAQQPVSPEWSRKVVQSESLIAKAQQLAPNVHPDDRREIERLIEQLRHGLSAGAAEELTAALAELEDLVFYLKDV